MTGVELYRWLMGGAARPLCEQFDAHVVASLLGVACDEAQSGGSLCNALGLSAAELAELANAFFPHAAALWETAARGATPSFDETESCLQQLLGRASSERTRFEQLLARVVARRAQRPNHLWQDLGLRNRRELSWLMSRHFEPLALRNQRDMKWKKFLYRTICRDEGTGLCTAPSCSECSDFAGCFGDEGGESLLAIARRDAERADAAKAALSQNRQSLPSAPPAADRSSISAGPAAGTAVALGAGHEPAP